MTPPWAGLLFPDGRPLAYAVTLAGRTCIHHWASYDGEGEGGLHRLTFLAEIDQEALGSGIGTLRARGTLWCGAGLEPVRYDLDSGGSTLRLDFAADAVAAVLPDGSRQRIERAGAAFLSDGNFPATMALAYAAVAEGGPHAAAHLRLRLFVANTLVTVPYDTMPGQGRWHRTSHRSEVLIDPSGVMIAARLPDSGLEVTLLRPPPPLPDWRDSPQTAAPRLTYHPPSGATFRLEDVRIDGPVTAIGATLSIPPGPGPFPAVLFISGSGCHDRHGIAGDMDIGSHEVLDHLAGHGFLGLRFDTRGAGTTALGADILDRGLVSDIADARACLAFLRARPEAAGQPLFLIGHSQGATVAMALAGADQGADLRGVVLMAAMGRDLDDVLADQVQAQAVRLGLDEARIATLRADARAVADLIRAGTAWDEAKVPHHLLAIFRTPTWYGDFLRHAPTDLIAGVGCPILLCQGGADFQISPERDAAPLLAAARRAGKDCTLALFPGLDHLFKRSAGQSSPAEYFVPRPVAPEFLNRLRTWLLGH